MLLLNADRVITARAGVVHEPGAVLIEDRTIRWVGAPTELPSDLAAGAERIDLGPATVLPGLIDAHVHLGFDGSATPVEHMKAQTDLQQLVVMLRHARELLHAGVTTARDLGARGFLDIEVKGAIADGLAEGPRLITSARPITVTGGHCWFMGGEADGIDELRHMVRLHHKMGADLIKVMATGGFMTPGSAPWFAQYTEDELRAVVEEAHRVDKKVAAHAHGSPGIARAARAGVGTIEHCSFAGEGSVIGGKHVTDYDERAVETIAEGGIHVCPTTNCNYLRFGPSFWEPRAERMASMREAGVQFVAGTDAGINNTPHGEYVGGLEALIASGMSTAEVIEAATIHAARALGVDAVTGSLEEGKAADLIAVGGDPLKGVGALRDLRMVLVQGSAVTLPASARAAFPGSVG